MYQDNRIRRIAARSDPAPTMKPCTPEILEHAKSLAAYGSKLATAAPAEPRLNTCTNPENCKKTSMRIQ